MGARCILLGLDGATYDLLDPWMDAGILPHLKDLLSRGGKGVLRSTDPPTTPPAWTSVSRAISSGRSGPTSAYPWRREVVPSPVATPATTLLLIYCV